LKETTPIETGDDDDIILWFWMWSYPLIIMYGRSFVILFEFFEGEGWCIAKPLKKWGVWIHHLENEEKSIIRERGDIVTLSLNIYESRVIASHEPFWAILLGRSRIINNYRLFLSTFRVVVFISSSSQQSFFS
jgi:hypothetical protein